MEKKSISGKDILRMDGLLPPTRRLPVCNAVTSADKKKEKKWSFGGILKRISSIRDYDSSSNDEIVYCTRQPRPRTVFNRKSHSVVLHPVEKSSSQQLGTSDVNNAAEKLLDSTNLQRDSLNSRSSDGSLDGLSKKARKSKLKAQIEAKRDRICADSSSDEDSRKSCNSLTRYQGEAVAQSVQKNGSCNRKSRAARTERYIKRISRDEGHRFSENLNNITNKRSNIDFINEEQSSVATNANELFQPLPQSSHFIGYSSSNTFPVKRSENSRQSETATSNFQARSSTDLTKQSNNQYITDLNQNNTYAKPNVLHKSKNYANQEENNYLFNSPTSGTSYTESYDYTINRELASRSSSPPEPPPRDPRCRVFAYNCNSFPFNGKYRLRKYDDILRTKINDIHEITKDHLKSLRSYESNNENSWCDSIEQCPRRPLSLTMSPTQVCNLSECTNNRHNSTGRHVDEPIIKETEAMKCRRRNDRNDQLTSSFKNYDTRTRESNLSATYIKNMRNNSVSSNFDKSVDSPQAKLPIGQIKREDVYNLPSDASVMSAGMEGGEEKQTISEQEALERKRSSKNLEEALSELEAIYNSLRLGDEDLLDRAERRSMEEFSLRRATIDTVPFILEDSKDRTKDDMAYRRMNPKERPASLSDAVGQSALSDISYLIASPVLSRRNATDDYLYANYQTRRNEPDVTRDDVVYRNIHHANNTLKVIDPQPPFGIPLGPVTTATESDYLHTTPSKQDQPRSSYIPRCEPDIVTDDLAYRTLRKDANTSKSSTVESKSGVVGDQKAIFGTKKKRAVRSLSANLYGLINHDRIHLRREPSLQEMKDSMGNRVMDIKSLSARTERRVVSDGELSDYDTRWRTNSFSKGSKIDINGNHPVPNAHRKKLRVYISPSAQMQNFESKNETMETQDCAASSAASSKPADNESHALSAQDMETDFTAYSRLCQDLVNLIEEQNDVEVKPIEVANSCSEVVAKVDASSDSNKMEEKSSTLRIQSLGSHYPEKNHEKRKESIDQVDAGKLSEAFVNVGNETSERPGDNTFDFYLRVADENVKLIAEAFSSVADHLRDSRLNQKNSLTSQRSEIETDSTAPNTSSRSSVTYSQDDTNDDTSATSRTTDALNIVPKEETTIILNEDHDLAETKKPWKNEPRNDPELDLSKAVHDLQVAAASLCERGTEIEEIEALLRKEPGNDVSCDGDAAIREEDVPSLNAEHDLVLSNGERVEHGEEKTVVPTAVKSLTDERDPNCEGIPALDHS
ncbi:uncharacterized protein LOC143430866 isoform X2 [Xylocopa sonorina]|uniref:uncharacterized protein LOC143430866 isoform X2 n=1 Tax=Xylocopa sonorina TaxID=1818115 RepID=UPI00403A7E15